MNKSILQQIKDFVMAPLRLTLLPNEWCIKLGLTSLEEERIYMVLPYIRGKLLDIGAWRNTLVKKYGNGVGIDVYDWGGGAVVVENSSELPFSDEEFDTVTFLASLNHIPYREVVLREAHRLLKEDGLLLITMINPILGYIGHRIFWWYSEEKERGMEPGEVYGLMSSEIRKLCREAGFIPTGHRRFVYGLNNLYIAKKRSTDAGGAR